jgi:hypothetical protein
MKFLLLTTIFIASTSIVLSQETVNKKDSGYFVVLYTIGENWDHTKQAHEQQYFKEHSAYLSELRKAKKIEIGARFSDIGMILLKADSEAEALDIISKDAAVQNKIFKTEFFSFFPFYKGCIE